jgi:tetratricopeptide (TPR) repeat protein
MDRQQHLAGAKSRWTIPPGIADRLEAGLKHQQAGRLADAEECYRQVLAAQPDNADALHLLGVIAYQVRRHDAAIVLIGQAIARNNRNPLYFSNFGLALQQQGMVREAIASYDGALALEPNYAEAHNNRGDALRALNRHEEALASLARAVAILPSFAEAHNNRGIALQELGRHEEALASYAQALAHKPAYADAHYNRGNALRELRRFDEAVAAYDAALAQRPDYAEAFNNRANALLALRRPDDAMASYDRALALKPDYAEAFNNRGVLWQEQKQFAQALADYDKALALLPGCAEAMYNRGNALLALMRFEKALQCYDAALTLKPDYPEALYNRGNALKELRRFDAALDSYGQALALRPDYAEAHWNESYVRLLTGDFARGLSKIEGRWTNAALGLRQRDFVQPLWLGSVPLDGKTILLHADQGLGDAIFFARYVPLLAARGARVIVEVEEPLRALMSGLEGVSACVADGTATEFDLHCPMSSLPLAFETRLATIPAAPYLRAPAPDQWAKRLGPRHRKGRPRIGLSWAGNPRHANDRNRSMALDALAPLLDVAAEFVTLQKDVREGDQATLRKHGRLRDLGPSLRNFSDSAELISQLDLVITVDTSVAHLAGALGAPVWVLLPFAPDWRWLLDRDDSPWYPTARLFRQSEAREWGSVVARVRDALQGFVEDYRAGHGDKP